MTRKKLPQGRSIIFASKSVIVKPHRTWSTLLILRSTFELTYLLLMAVDIMTKSKSIVKHFSIIMLVAGKTIERKLFLCRRASWQGMMEDWHHKYYFILQILTRTWNTQYNPQGKEALSIASLRKSKLNDRCIPSRESSILRSKYAIIHGVDQLPPRIWRHYWYR